MRNTVTILITATTLTTATTLNRATTFTTVTKATTLLYLRLTWHWALRTFHGVVHELLTRKSVRERYSQARSQVLSPTRHFVGMGRTEPWERGCGIAHCWC